MSRPSHELLLDLEEHIVWYASRLGVSQDKSDSIARMVIDTIRGEWGGLSIYLSSAGNNSEGIGQQLLGNIDAGVSLGRQNDKSSRFLDDFRKAVVAAIVQFGGDAAKRDDIAAAVVEGFVGRWGGLTIYIPQGWMYDNNSRDEKIYAKFNGSNTMALAREYDLSMQQIYNIVRKQRQLLIDKYQTRLPSVL